MPRPFQLRHSLPQESTAKPIEPEPEPEPKLEACRLRAEVAEAKVAKLERKMEATEAAKKQFTTMVHLVSMLFALVATSNQAEGGLNSAPVGKSALFFLSLRSTTLRPKFWRTVCMVPFIPPAQEQAGETH